MPYFSQADLARARELDLLTYLENYEPDELVKISSNVYSTRTHDSLKISNGLWMWWSRGVGGRSALEYLIKVQGLTLYEAAHRILGKSFSVPNINKPPPKTESKVFELPERADNNDKIIAYLSRRGISKTVINYFTQNGMLYQSKNMNNVVFVGFDKNNKARYAAVRGTGGHRFVGDVSGSDKSFSFRLTNGESDMLHVFEGAVDLLSYATFMQQQGFDFRSQNLVSLSGVSNGDMSKVPVSLKSFLEAHGGIKNINLHLDRDPAGRKAARSLINLLSSEYEVKSLFVPAGKDVNDYLCYTLNLPFNSHNDRRDAR